MGPGQVWQSRERRRHDGYQRPVASSQPDGGALVCGGERRRAVALDHAHRHADHTRHTQAGRWPLEAPTATTLRRVSPRLIWQSRERRRHDGYQRPVASSQPDGGALVCGGERRRAVALDHAHRHAGHTRHNQAGRWPLEAPTATTLRRVSPRPIWRSRGRRRHDGYQRPARRLPRRPRLRGL